jgi:SAM-dependent methyltransferase
VGRDQEQQALTATSYDDVPYPGHPYAQTHPDRLATLAILFGLEPAPVESCRVLELGCGDGGNLVPMALGLPGAQFAGIDSAATAIERGRALASALDLTNVTLEPVAIEDYEPAAGAFDYVIAHGVYSWVAPPLRDRLLALCGRALAPGGVAYVSYNALPGARIRQALRDMLRFHTAGLEDPRERAESARALLRFLVEGWPATREHTAALRHQAEQALERSDASLLHDELAEFNEPVGFAEFAEHAGAHGLQYLAEADFFEMQTAVAPEAVRGVLRSVEDPLRREQYLDFIKGRMFRQNLLCHAETVIDRRPRPEVVERLAFSSPAVPGGPPDGGGRVVFQGPTGTSLTTDQPAVIGALERGAERWPGAVWVRDLPETDRGVVCEALLGGFAANLISLHASPPRVAHQPGERPEASPLARRQAAEGEFVTTLRHRSVHLEDDLGRRLITLLDGTRDRAALAAEMRPYADGEVETALERSLDGLARLALLVA